MLCRFRSVLVGFALGLATLAPPSPAAAGCGAWNCWYAPACGPQPWYQPPAFYYSAPCLAVYPPQPVYRVEQGPIHNVVVAPYEVPRVRFDYLPPRFFADCGCWR